MRRSRRTLRDFNELLPLLELAVVRAALFLATCYAVWKWFVKGVL